MAILPGIANGKDQLVYIYVATATECLMYSILVTMGLNQTRRKRKKNRKAEKESIRMDKMWHNFNIHLKLVEERRLPIFTILRLRRKGISAVAF